MNIIIFYGHITELYKFNFFVENMVINKENKAKTKNKIKYFRLNYKENYHLDHGRTIS